MERGSRCLPQTHRQLQPRCAHPERGGAHGIEELVVATGCEIDGDSGSGLVPIENWDHWYGGIMRDIKYAETEREIDAAIDRLVCFAGWLSYFPNLFHFNNLYAFFT